MPISIIFSDKTVRVAVELNGAIESAITELPKREWVGLTDEERHYIFLGIEVFGLSVTEIILEAEAKLKEKNS